MSKLTPKQAAFVREYLIDLNASAAATRAGYAKSPAREASRDILTKPVVQEAVQLAMARRASRVDDSAEKVLSDIARIGEAAEERGKFDVALKAAELRGKHLGMFKTLVEHGGTGGGPIKFTVTFEDGPGKPSGAP